MCIIIYCFTYDSVAANNRCRIVISQFVSYFVNSYDFSEFCVLCGIIVTSMSFAKITCMNILNNLSTGPLLLVLCRATKLDKL